MLPGIGNKTRFKPDCEPINGLTSGLHRVYIGLTSGLNRVKNTYRDSICRRRVSVGGLSCV